MKRKLFIGLASLAIIAVAAIVTVSSVNASSTESDLLTKNLEALTDNVTINGGITTFDDRQLGLLTWGGDNVYPCCFRGGTGCSYYLPCEYY